MKKRILSLVAVSAIVASVFAGCGGGSSSKPASSSGSASASTSSDTAATADSSNAEYKIRVGHVLANTHPYELGLKKLSEIAAEKSGGKIAIDVFGNSQLGNERDMVEALQLGSQEMFLFPQPFFQALQTSSLFSTFRLCLIQQKTQEWYATVTWEQKYFTVLMTRELQVLHGLKTVSDR